MRRFRFFQQHVSGACKLLLCWFVRLHLTSCVSHFLLPVSYAKIVFLPVNSSPFFSVLSACRRVLLAPYVGGRVKREKKFRAFRLLRHIAGIFLRQFRAANVSVSWRKNKTFLLPDPDVCLVIACCTPLCCVLAHRSCWCRFNYFCRDRIFFFSLMGVLMCGVALDFMRKAFVVARSPSTVLGWENKLRW